MVTKQEIFGGQAAFGGGITETVRRRTIDQQNRVSEQEQKEAEVYLERINQGQITNVNQIPQNLRKYFDIETTLNNTRNDLSNEIQIANSKEQEVRNKYQTEVQKLRDWRDNKLDRTRDSQAKSDIRKDYEKELLSLQRDYLPEISYYQELSGRLKEKVGEINKGEIISKDYILEYAKNYANYEKKLEKAKISGEQDKIKIEEAKQYADRINKGEITISQVPSNLQKFITPTTTTTISVQEVISKTPEQKLMDVIRASGDNYNKEVNRYQDLGYTQKEAVVLATESIKQGGMSFTPQYAQKLIVDNSIRERNEEIKQELKDSFREIFSGKESYRFNTLRETLDSIQRFANAGIQAIAQGITTTEYKFKVKELQNMQNSLTNVERKLNQDLKGEYKDSYDYLLKEIPKTKDRVSVLQDKIKAGSTTAYGKVGAIALDIGTDIFIPAKGIADLTLLVNQIVPRQSDVTKFYASIKETGFTDTIKAAPTQLYNNVVNFFTNKEQKKENQLIKEDNQKQIEEIKQGIKDGIYDPTQANRVITELNNEIKIIDTQQKEMNQNSLLTIGTIGLIVASLGKAKMSRLKLKEIDLDLNSAKMSADNFNKLEANKVISETTPVIKESINPIDYRKIVLSVDDLKYIEDNLNIINKGDVNIKDVSNIEVKVNSQEFQGPAYVRPVNQNLKIKRPIIEKVRDLLGQPKLTEDFKINYYVKDVRPNYFQNSVSITIQLKNGRNISFSVISKSNKNLARIFALQKNSQVRNILKYGTDKRILLSRAFPDSDIVASTLVRQGRNRFIETDRFLGREIGTGVVGVKRSPKVLERLNRERNKIQNMNSEQLNKLSKEIGLSVNEIIRQTRLSPEEVWGLGQPVAVVKEKVVKSAPAKQTIKIGDQSVFNFISQRDIGIQTVKNMDLNIDLSTFNFVTKNQLDTIKNIPKQKRSISQNTLIDIANKVDNAIKTGKSNLILENQIVKKLSTTELNNIQSSISATLIPKQKFRDLTSRIQSNINKIKSSISKLEAIQLTAVNSLNRINSSISSTAWTGLTSVKSDSLLKELNDQQSKVATLEKLANSQSLIIQQDIKVLQDQLQGLTQATQLQQIQQLLQQQKLTQSQISSLQTRIKQIDTRIKESKRTINITPKIPIPKKQQTVKDVVLKDDEYGIFARKSGKDFLLGKRRTKTQAKKLLINTLENTLRASGFVKKGDKKIKLQDFGADFRKSKVDPFRVVEKSRVRINTPGEKRELKMAREKSKRTRRKTPEQYWLG